MAVNWPTHAKQKPAFNLRLSDHWTAKHLIFAAPAQPNGVHYDLARGVQPAIISAVTPKPVAQYGFGMCSSHDGTTSTGQNFGDLGQLDGLSTLTTVTMATWGSVFSGSANDYLWGSVDGGGIDGFSLRHKTAGTDGFSALVDTVTTGAVNVEIAESALNLNGALIHVTRYDGANIDYWILDTAGIIVKGTPGSATGNITMQAGNVLNIGTILNSASFVYQGEISDVRFYNVAWSDAQMTAFLRDKRNWWAAYRADPIRVHVPAGGAPATHPVNPFGHPLYGPFAGPIGP